MRLYLQTIPVGDEPPRYAQLVLEQDMLGGWTLYRETGTQGGRSTLKREQFLNQAEAITAWESARDLQLRRGFHVTSAQGVDDANATA